MCSRLKLTNPAIIMLTRAWSGVFFAFACRLSVGFQPNLGNMLFMRSRTILGGKNTEKADTTSTTNKVTDCDSELYRTLLARFQGDFDNYNQVVEDRKKGLLPRELGGHEHIHCSLVPVSETTRLAAFYFDGVPEAIFRFRFYELVPINENEVDTILYVLHPDLEAQLRQSSNPMAWPAIYNSFDQEERILLLPKCDVRWSFSLDPVQHKYAVNEAENGIHAIMVQGQALVESQMMPGQKILIKDQLSLWEEALWIHDRGYNPDTMEFIYGNQKGIPYRLERVANMDENGRKVVDESLAWTMGSNFRTDEEYASKLKVVGGGSRPKR